ncbi:MAG: nuclear transport factor 2 family protein [Actinomycetota bacterium]
MNVPVDPADFVGIQRLVNRYSDAVVHRNGEQWSSCWADDAVWDLGGGRLVEGKEAIVKLWFAAMGGMAAVVQHTHNGDATYEGSGRDVAVGRWAISERFLTADGHRGLLLAHYDDAYRKADGAWLFTRRFLQVHYRGAPDLSGDFLNTRGSLESRGLGPQV